MKIECKSCRHRIDESARLCPFCGADPETGRKVDTAPIVERHFPRRGELSAREQAFDFIRARQGIAITLVLLLAGLLAIILHQMVTRRTLARNAEVTGVPLTELADISDRTRDTPPPQMPEIRFAAEGDPRRVRTFLMEPGAVAPPSPSPSPTASPQPGGAAQPQPRVAQPTTAGRLPQTPATSTVR